MIFILSVITILILCKHSKQTEPPREKYNNTPDNTELTYNEWYSLYYYNKPYNLPESVDEERMTKDYFEDLIIKGTW